MSDEVRVTAALRELAAAIDVPAPGPAVRERLEAAWRAHGPELGHRPSWFEGLYLARPLTGEG